MTALESIREEIARSGPMPFDRFMEIALYDPDHGYYTSGRLRSDRAGDFLTSPEVSPLFGETVSRFIAAEIDRVGRPFTLVEVGAGSGSLLGPLLAALPEPPDRVVAVEVSPTARESLAERLPGIEVHGSLEAVDSRFRGAVVANELLDNLPVAVAVRSGPRWLERVVVVVGQGLGYAHAEARPAVTAWARRQAADVPDGSVVEVQLAAAAWLRDALGRVDAGAVVVFDYGDTPDGLAGRRGEGTVRTYRGHHLGPDPLAEPGSTDITVDVDFEALLDIARQSGFDAAVLRQHEFLERWGLSERLEALRDTEMGAARDGQAMRRLTLRSERTAGEPR